MCCVQTCSPKLWFDDQTGPAVVPDRPQKLPAGLQVRQPRSVVCTYTIKQSSLPQVHDWDLLMGNNVCRG